MPQQRRKNKRPISDFESELLTVLEFARVASKQFAKTADKILSEMDLSDEAFHEDIKTLGDVIGFDFEDDGTDND